MHNQCRQDVVVDLRDLTPEDCRRFLDLQIGILEARHRESEADEDAAKCRARAETDWAKRAAVCREQEELRLATQKADEAHNQKCRELAEMRERQWQRPSRMQFAEVTYDGERKQFSAAYCGVVAYGDSPEMACDNFDHLWLYGN